MRYRTEVAALPSTCNIVAVQRFERGRLVFAPSDRYRVIDLGMGKSPVLPFRLPPSPLPNAALFGALSAHLFQSPHMHALHKAHHDPH
jgi:hypothetical protein